jgi:hypothetical protein
MKFLRIPVATLLALALLGSVASAQTTATLVQGTLMTAVMDSQLSSATANVGDTFSMHVVAPYPNDDDRYAGATITGHVIKVVRANRGTTPELQFGIDRLILLDGTSADLSAQITSAAQKQENRSGAAVALSTLGGMLLGNAIGKTIFHTGGGGIVGAAGGFLYGYNQKSNVTLPAGAQVGLTLTRDTAIRRQSRPPG